jgi:hypothetical protein
MSKPADALSRSPLVRALILTQNGVRATMKARRGKQALTTI